MNWIRYLIKQLKVSLRRMTYGVQNRIFFPFAFFHIVLVFAVSAITIFYVNDVAGKENVETLTSLSKQMTGSFDNYINSLKDSLTGLASNSTSTIPRIVNQEYTTNDERYNAYHSFYSSTTALLRTESFNTNQIYLVNPSDHYILSNDAYLYMDRTQTPAWIEKIRSSSSDRYYHYPLDFQEPKPMQDEFCFAVAIDVARFSQSYLKKEVFLVMVVGTSRMRYAISQSSDMPFDTIVIIDEENNIVYHYRSLEQDSSLIQMIGQGNEDISIDDKSYHIYSSISENTNWKIYFFHDQALSKQMSERVVRATVLMAGFALVVLLLITYFIAQSISKPVKHMIALTDKIGRGDFDISPGIVSNDEIGKLYRHFYTMADKISTLVNQVYQVEILHRDAEIRALQQQINPHFIYNTLEIINALTNKQDAKGVKLVTQKVASIFRYCTHGSRDLVSIRAELQYTYDYIAIQKIRFQDAVVFQAEVDEELSDCLMLKFILQPVIENCYAHGFKGIDEFVPSIRLDCKRKKNMVVFSISDNGVGMEQERLEKLSKELERAVAGVDHTALTSQSEGDDLWEKSSSIGLRNVHARIRMKYNEPYGIQVESEPGQGTTVHMYLPYLLSEGGEENCILS